MTLTEAAACGTPAVATRISGHTDAIVDGESGLLTSLDDLGNRIATVLQDKSLRERLTLGAARRGDDLRWEQASVRAFAVLASSAMRNRD